MTKIGYLRVSTVEQKPDRQIDGLKEHCDELRVERISATARMRPVFDALLAELRPHDTLVVWDLDRAFRSTIDALVHSEMLRDRGIEFQIVTLGVDTSTADGRLIYTVLAAFAEHERNRLSERTKEGLRAARRRGVRLGRPPVLTNSQIDSALAELKSNRSTIKELAAEYNIHPWTLSRAIRRNSQ
ncbi:MAG: recombinase family protein [Ahrensia sp.]|nr:recombinase family protein [Ahrensia sp.]